MDRIKWLFVTYMVIVYFVVFLILAVIFFGISAVMIIPTYWLITYCIERFFRKKDTIQGWCRYRLNNYFIIKKKRSGNPHIYMDMSMPCTFSNFGFCLRKRRFSILKRFSNALTDLQTELPIWFDKCNQDVYLTTNSSVLNKIIKAEQMGIIKIKKITKLKDKKQFIERKSICNPNKDKNEMFEVVIGR